VPDDALVVTHLCVHDHAARRGDARRIEALGTISRGEGKEGREKREIPSSLKFSQIVYIRFHSEHYAIQIRKIMQYATNHTSSKPQGKLGMGSLTRRV
jgi:hypothetical protein